MKATTVSFAEMTNKKKNPTMCMSALRYNGHCVECTLFKAAYRASSHSIGVETIIETMKCKPLLTEEQIKLLLLREKAQIKKEDLQRIIDEIDENLAEATEQVRTELDKKYTLRHGE